MGNVSCNVNVFSPEAPRSTRSSVDTVFTMVREPARRTRAAASWPATSAPRNRRQNGLAVAVPVRSRSEAPRARIDSDGTSPNRMVAVMHSSPVTSAARASRPIAPALCSCGGSSMRITCNVQIAIGIATTPARIAINPLSASRYRTSLDREAPSARRIDISRSRADTRASSRFATFMQATSSTSDTAIVMMPNSGRTDPTSSSRSAVTTMGRSLLSGVSPGSVLQTKGFLPRLLQRGSGCEAGDRVGRDGATGDLHVGAWRDPDLCVHREGVACRHHTDHRECASVQKEWLIQRRVGQEAAPPQPLADHGDRRIGTRLFTREGTAKDRLRAHRRKEAGRHGGGANALGMWLAADIDSARDVDPGSCEDRLSSISAAR